MFIECFIFYFGFIYFFSTFLIKFQMRLEVVQRDQWGALPPKDSEHEEAMEYPLKKVVYNFDVKGARRCHSLEECKEAMRKIQKYYMEDKQLNDIPYK